MLCTNNERTLSSNIDLHALLEAARLSSIRFHMIALRKTRLGGTTWTVGRQSTRHLWRVSLRSVGGVGFTVQLSVVHLESSEILSRRLPLRLHLQHCRPIIITNCYSPTSAADASALSARSSTRLSSTRGSSVSSSSKKKSS